MTKLTEAIQQIGLHTDCMDCTAITYKESVMIIDLVKFQCSKAVESVAYDSPDKQKICFTSEAIKAIGSIK